MCPCESAWYVWLYKRGKVWFASFHFALRFLRGYQFRHVTLPLTVSSPHTGIKLVLLLVREDGRVDVHDIHRRVVSLDERASHLVTTAEPSKSDGTGQEVRERYCIILSRGCGDAYVAGRTAPTVEESEGFLRLKAKSADVLPLADIAEEQLGDEEYLEIKRGMERGNAKKRRALAAKYKFRDELLLVHDQGRSERVYVPKTLRSKLMHIFHDGDFLMHAGRDATLHEIKVRYFWKGMDADVTEHVRKCLWCSRAKRAARIRAGKLQPIVHTHDGSTLSMDLVGPFPPAMGLKYILTMFDPFSHFLVAEALENKEAVTVFHAFVQRIMLQGRLPARVVTDNGSEFKNELMQGFLKAFEVRFGYSIPYHPQSNSVGRVHRFINATLRIAVNKSNGTASSWVEALPYIVFSYNKMFPGTRVSPLMLRTHWTCSAIGLNPPFSYLLHTHNPTNICRLCEVRRV